MHIHAVEPEDPEQELTLVSGTVAMFCCSNGKGLFFEPAGEVKKTKYTYVGEGHGQYDVDDLYRYVQDKQGPATTLDPGMAGMQPPMQHAIGLPPMLQPGPEAQGMQMNMFPMPLQPEEVMGKTRSGVCWRCQNLRREFIALILALLLLCGVFFLLSMQTASPHGRANVDSGASNTFITFNCDEEYEHWRAEWSKIKQDWCCNHHNRGCLHDVRDPSNHMANFEFKAK